MPGIPGRGRPIAEFTSLEIRGMLLGGTVIIGGMGIASATSWSQAPAWFLWPLRLVCALGLGSLWYRCLRELRARWRKRHTGARS